MNSVIIKPTSQFEVGPHENKYLKSTIKCGQGMALVRSCLSFNYSLENFEVWIGEF